MYLAQIARVRRRRAWPLLGCVLLAAACATPPAQETVTLDADRLTALPVRAPTVAVTPQLPTRDEDIEAAGDCIAEAITSLGKRRNANAPARNVAAATRALEQAEAVLTHALRKPHDDAKLEALRVALRELNAAERTIQRGALADAVRDLNQLDKQLDDLHGAAQPTPAPTQ